MPKKSTLSIILPFIFILALASLAFLFNKTDEEFNADNNQQNAQEQNQDNQEEDSSFEYASLKFNIAATLPNFWQDKYSVTTKTEDESEFIFFNYQPTPEATPEMIFFVKTYPATYSIFELQNTPNTRIVAQDLNKIYTISQALAIPYAQGTLDEKNYVGMINDFEKVIQTIRPTSGIYTTNLRIFENLPDEHILIDIKYPEIKGVANADELNSMLEQRIKNSITAFKENLIPWEEDIAPEGSHNSLHITYWPKFLDSDLISLYFSGSQYLAGAAHPNPYSFVINYDLQNQQEIKLEDLFKVGQTEYLNKISDLVRQELADDLVERDIELDDEYFLQGTQPEIKNFANFNLSQEGIVFNFDPYHIGPYAAGNFFAEIKYEDLQDILKDEFVK